GFLKSNRRNSRPFVLISWSSCDRLQTAFPMSRPKWKSTSRTARASAGCWILSIIAPPFTGPDSHPSELKIQLSSTAIPSCQVSSSIFERSCNLTRVRIDHQLEGHPSAQLKRSGPAHAEHLI